MDFNHFISIVPKIKQEQLLGEISHLKMCPPEREDLMREIDFSGLKPREAAIMMLIYPKDQQSHLALIKRTSYNGVHSSQIAFPGGKAEEFDADFQETALRETHEEVGIAPEKITVIKSFTSVYIPPSNFMVHPFLGYSKQELTFTPDSTEVAGIIEFPIADFLNDNIAMSKKMTTAYNVDIEVPAFKIEEHFVWGATAMMLSELKDVLKNVL